MDCLTIADRRGEQTVFLQQKVDFVDVECCRVENKGLIAVLKPLPPVVVREAVLRVE